MNTKPDIVVRLCDPWLDISTAPKDGTPIQAEIPGHGSDNIIAWSFGLADANAEICGGWHFIGDKEPPDDWTDGVCWAVNADGRKSTEPTLGNYHHHREAVMAHEPKRKKARPRWRPETGRAII